ncbi:MAG TPA: ABC transporter substrate-binding protein [Casimicrobiaceae bacterium]|nr:ABC transporter substrate-binding protein [Casimicrobiaceae bacterium]
MNRREILAYLGAALLHAVSRGAHAQVDKGVHRIGVLQSDSPVDDPALRPLFEDLRELGWIDGHNLIVERRSARGDTKLLQQYAEEFVRMNVEVIVTTGTPPTVAARKATARIPIVMQGADPVSTGLVSSLGRPGGNITGFSNDPAELEGKLLALLRELMPGLERVGVVFNPANVYWDVTRDKRRREYQSLGIQPIFLEVTAAGQIEDVVIEAQRRRAQALAIGNEGFWENKRDLLMRVVQRQAIPLVTNDSNWAEAGALLTLEADADGSEGNRALAYLVDRILRGAKPADLPIQQPQKFLFCINLKTAKALGLTVPKSLLSRADRVIQ